MNSQKGHHSSASGHAGLPKACKLWSAAAVTAGAANAQTFLTFDTVAFNYGSFVFPLSAGRMTGITVPEAGVYDVRAQGGGIANSQYFGIYLAVNGSFTLPDGTSAADQVGGPASLASVVRQLDVPLELKAGDNIQVTFVQGPGPQPSLATYTWLYVKKEGGH